MRTQNSDAWPGMPETVHGVATSSIPFEDFGYLPGYAEAAQAAYYPNPHLNPQPYFTQTDYDIANWFTTRVHLSPLGKAILK